MNDDITWGFFQADLRKFNADLKRETKEINNLKKIQLRNPADRQSIVSSSCSTKSGSLDFLHHLPVFPWLLWIPPTAETKSQINRIEVCQKLPADQSQIYPVPKELKEPGWM